MRNILSEKEWLYLSQMIFRINQATTYEEFAYTVMKQIRVLIPYRKALVLQCERYRDRILQSRHIAINPPDCDFDEGRFIHGGYRSSWYEYMFRPWSSVFRQSDINLSDFENTDLYRNIWKAQGIHHGMHCALIHNDRPLAMVSLYRAKEEEDFTERELFIAENLLYHMQLKMYELLYPTTFKTKKPQQEQPVVRDVHPIQRLVHEHNLTRQESRVLQLLYEGKNSTEICDRLRIQNTTLRKHVRSIYDKLNVKNRSQLLSMLV